MRPFLFAALFLAFAPSAAAADIGTEEVLGLGVMLGTPIGATGKLYVAGPTHAVDFALGTEFLGYGDDRFTVLATYLYQPGTVFRAGAFEVPWHVGLGGQLWTDDLDDDLDVDFDEDGGFGLRVPVGLDMNLRDLPVQFTAEVAATVPLVPELEVGFQIFGAVRYYLF